MSSPIYGCAIRSADRTFSAGEAAFLHDSRPVSGPAPRHFLDVLGGGRQHDEPVEAERDPGALRQAVFEGGKEILVDRVGLAVKRLLLRLITGEAPALLGGIGQFAEGVGEFEAADIDLETLGETGIAGAAARQCRHRQRVVVEDGRRAQAEHRLDPLEEDAEKERLPIIARMRRHPDFLCRGGQALDIRSQRVGCGREKIDAAEFRERCGDAEPPPRQPRVRRSATPDERFGAGSVLAGADERFASSIMSR